MIVMMCLIKQFEASRCCGELILRHSESQFLQMFNTEQEALKGTDQLDQEEKENQGEEKLTKVHHIVLRDGFEMEQFVQKAERKR